MEKNVQAPGCQRLPVSPHSTWCDQVTLYFLGTSANLRTMRPALLRTLVRALASDGCQARTSWQAAQLRAYAAPAEESKSSWIPTWLRSKLPGMLALLNKLLLLLLPSACLTRPARRAGFAGGTKESKSATPASATPPSEELTLDSAPRRCKHSTCAPEAADELGETLLLVQASVPTCRTLGGWAPPPGT